MQTTRKWLSRVIQLAGLLLLLALFAWGVDWASRQAELAQNATLLPAASEPLSYPPPPEQATPLPTPSATVLGYPPPPVYPTLPPTFTPTPTTTPWHISALPPLPTYAPPGPFSGMRVLVGKTNYPGYYLLNVDGSNEVRLPDWPRDQANGLSSQLFRVSPDGSKILYTLTNPTNPDIASIWKMNPDGSNKQLVLAAGNDWFPEDAIWSPDGAHIAYRRAYTNEIKSLVQRYELWIIDLTSGNERMIVDNPVFWIDSFGGKALVFQWMRNGYIYFVNHDGYLFSINPETGNLFAHGNSLEPTDLHLFLLPDGEKMISLDNEQSDKIIHTGLSTVEVQGKFVGSTIDGSFIAYIDPSSKEVIWHKNLISGQLIQITQDAVGGFGYSIDGKYYAYSNVSGLMIWEIDTNNRRLIVSCDGVIEPI